MADVDWRGPFPDFTRLEGIAEELRTRGEPFDVKLPVFIDAVAMDVSPSNPVYSAAVDLGIVYHLDSAGYFAR